MKGSIRQLTPKSFQLQVYTGIKIDDKPTRYYETVRGRESDARKRLRELLVSLDKGIPVPQGKLKVGELLDNWLAGYVKANCSQRTYDGYESIIIHHLKPNLGAIKLKDLHAQMINTYYGKACEKLSARTVHHFHRVLYKALKYAMELDLIGRNPCANAHPPRPIDRPMRTLTPSEAELLLDRARDIKYYPVIYTALSTGMRQAELLGLRWRDINLDMLSISVSQVLYKRHGVYTFKEPKTEHSRRRICMTSKLASYLKEYRKERENLYFERDQILGLDGLVFANPDGIPFNPSVLSHDFERLVKRIGLAGVRFHDLRHSFASLMLLQGANAKVISEALGHASVAFTLQVYSHIIEGMQADAMTLLDGILPVGISKNNADLTQISGIMSSKS